MNMQGMPMDRQGMHNPHDTFWRNDGVTIIFRSVVSLTSGDPILNKKRLLDKLGLYRQLGELNTFLQEQAQVPVTLHFLDDSDHPEDGEQDDRDQHSNYHLRMQCMKKKLSGYLRVSIFLALLPPFGRILERSTPVLRVSSSLGRVKIHLIPLFLR